MRLMLTGHYVCTGAGPPATQSEGYGAAEARPVDVLLNHHGRSPCTVSGWRPGCFYFRRARRHPQTEELRRTLQCGSIRGPCLNRLSGCETWPLVCCGRSQLDDAGSCRFRALCVDRQSAALRSQITGTDRDHFDARSVVCRSVRFIFCVLWLTNMRIGTRISVLRQTKWHEYLFRFFIGGAATVLADLVAMRFGSGIGGLFLAFPVIFPATATLIYSHEKKKKGRLGMSGAERGLGLAAADAYGATLGAIGLIVFAATVSWLIPARSTFSTLAAATIAWLSVSLMLWFSREYLCRRVRNQSSTTSQNAT